MGWGREQKNKQVRAAKMRVECTNLVLYCVIPFNVISFQSGKTVSRPSVHPGPIALVNIGTIKNAHTHPPTRNIPNQVLKVYVYEEADRVEHTFR